MLPATVGPPRRAVPLGVPRAVDPKPATADQVPLGRYPATVMTTIGVLALQGDVAEHLAILRELGVDAVPVKHAAQLDDLDGIVIPGGESTTIGKLAAMYGLLHPLRQQLAAGMPAFGTCAGAILLARNALHADGSPAAQPLLGVMDTVVRRNAFGRQVDSFEGDIEFEGLDAPVHAVFIRAPWVERVGPGVRVLGRAGGHDSTAKIVAVRQGHLLATAFHPELTGDPRVHRYFVAMAREARLTEG